MTEIQTPDLAAPRWWMPVVALGTGAGCIGVLQPILLGLLLGAGKLSLVEMGVAATAEAAGMTLATTLAAFFLPLRKLRRLAGGALVLLLIANAGTILASGQAIIALRLLGGMGSGILIWILMGMFTRSPTPARLFAIYITTQSILGLFLSQAMTAVIAPMLGFSGGYVVLCAMNVLFLVAVFLMPDSMGGRDTGILGLPPLLPGLAIVAISCYLAGILSVWVYILPLLKQLGYPAADAAHAVPVALAGQIVGGFAATFFAPRISPLRAWTFSILMVAATLVGLAISRGSIAMFAAVGAIGFLWLFVPPFHMPVMLGLDPSGRGPMLVGPAQLLGTSLGPLIASAVVSDQSVRPVIGVALAFMLASLVLLMLATRVRAATAAA